MIDLDSLEELEQVERQLRDTQTNITYDTKEYVVEHIVNRFDKKFFFIPNYQREFIWDKKRQAKFIESVLMGLPIPFMFGVQNRDGNVEILDGAQRINTLSSFLHNTLVLKGLERLDLLNGYTFDKLPSSQQNKFLDRSLRMIILPETVDQQIKLDMFERINTGSQDLKKSEIRKGAYSGPFYEFVQECALDDQFNRLCPVSAKGKDRGEREELILRFFAYSERYTEFKHSVVDFLNSYLIEKNAESFDKANLESQFRATLSYVERNLPAGFAKKVGAKSTPRVRFEAIAIGANLALQLNPDLPDRGDEFVQTKEFNIQVTSHASNSGPRLRGRLEFVRDFLLDDSDA